MSFSFSQIELSSQKDQIAAEVVSFTSISSEPTSQNKQSNSPPVEILASFEKSRLKIKVNCSKIDKDPFSYTRHCLILQVSHSTILKAKQFIESYFRKLEVGDLIKIIPISSDWKPSKWIEKTKNNSINIQKLIQIQNDRENIACNISTIVNKVLKKRNDYSNFMATTILLNQTPSKSIIEDIQNIKDLSKYTNYWKVLSLENKKEIKSQVPSEGKVKVINNIQGEVTSILSQLYRIRLASLNIKISCLNGSFYKTKFIDHNWRISGNILERSFTMIPKQSIYYQQLKINNLIDNLNVKFQVVIVSMNGDTYKTEGYLKILKKGNDRIYNCTTPCRASKQSSQNLCESEDSKQFVSSDDRTIVFQNMEEITFINAENAGEDI